MCQRKPATTQSAVRTCLTLIIARLPGWYVVLSCLAITPSSPAPSKRWNHSSATARSRLHGVRCTPPEMRRERLLEQRAPLGLRASAEIAPAVGEQVERDERRGRLGGELLHARRRRMQAQLQRVEVEPALRWR